MWNSTAWTLAGTKDKRERIHPAITKPKFIELPEGTVIYETGTILLAYRYPYRKSSDVIMVFNPDKDENVCGGDASLIHCLECGEDWYGIRGTEGFQSRLVGHIRRHDKRKKVRRLAA